METSSPAEHKDTVPTGNSGVGFTDGPWFLEGTDVMARRHGADGAEMIACAYGFENSRGKVVTTKESRANARLIAAAPDLYEALQDCAAVCAGETSSKGGLIAALERARAALKKARGES